MVTPGTKNSVRLQDLDPPKPRPSEALLRVLKLGIDGTDLEINQGLYGEPPAGSDFLVAGHESLATVEEIPEEVDGIEEGDLVVPTVRRPDGCINCQSGESDMCLTGGYKEHGIKGLHGFASEFTVSDYNFLVKVPGELVDVAVLLEPLSVAEKAVFQAFKIQERMVWSPGRALVLGAGPLGLLTALLLRLRGMEVSAVATRPRDSLKARVLGQIGGVYVNSEEQPIAGLGKFDLILEETGVASLALDALGLLKANGVMCLLGIYGSRQAYQDIGHVYTDLVLGNKILLGSVNANRRYFVQGLEDMAEIKEKFPGVLESLFTRTVTPSSFGEAYNPSKDDIKSVIEFQRASS